MKKIFTLIFLLCTHSVLFGQISISVILEGQTTSTNASAFGMNSGALTQGRLYLYVAITTGTTNNGTITATSTTWTQVLAVGNSTRRIQVFRCVPQSTVTGESVQLGNFGGGSTGYSEKMYEITGVPTTNNGADAIVQVATQAATTGANPSISINAVARQNNAILAFFGNDVNPFNGTAEAGWTEDRDLGYNTPTSGVYFTTRLKTNDNTIAVTAASSTWLGAVIELKGRRVYITKL